MRIFRVSEHRYLLQLEHGVGAGSLRGLGAAERAELDFYHLAEGRHDGLVVEEATEVAGLVGTLSRGEDGEPIPHVHATLCRPDGTALGGHVRQLVVGATLEIDLEVMPGVVRRRFDPRVGLHLLDACEEPDDS